MTPTEMAMLRQQMQGMGGQIGQPGGMDQLRQMLQSRPQSSMPMMQHEQRPSMTDLQGRGGHAQFGGPNASPMSRMFPNMGMSEGVPSNVTTTPMAAGLQQGQFSNGQRDLPAMKAMGK